MQLDLSRIYWLAGSPCAGKTTLSHSIASHFDWQIYHCDEWFDRHRQRADPHMQPTFFHISRLSGNDLWLRPVAEQISSEIMFCADEFRLVLEDLAHLASESNRPILFEGTPALPTLLKPLLPSTNHAFWLVPTEAFQRHYYAQRPWIHSILATTTDPEQAFDNWMARDAGFARWLEQHLHNLELPWLSVDGSLTLQQTTELLITHFGQAR